MFGAIGMGYFVYGKNQAKPIPMLAGALLCIFPYFISDTVAMLAVGAGLVAAPIFIGRDS